MFLQNGNQRSYIFFFFNDTATTEIYTLSLHDALPICVVRIGVDGEDQPRDVVGLVGLCQLEGEQIRSRRCQDRKSTRLNSSHSQISYAVFCLKKKKTIALTTLALATAAA